jgi:hypothetical protein
MPFMSPRLMGEGAYYAGKASRLPLRPAAQSAFQAGRLNEPLRITVHPLRTAGNPYESNPICPVSGRSGHEEVRSLG